MFWVSKSLKRQGGSHRSNLIGQELKDMTCGWSYGMCSIRGCAFPRGATILLRGGTPLSPQNCHVLYCWSIGRGGSLLPHTWLLFSYKWCALLHGELFSLVINWSFLPLHKLVRVLGRIAIAVVNIVSLLNWNKEGFGGKFGVDPCVVAHCHVQIYEVTLFYFICLCNLLKLAFLGVLLLIKDRVINLIWFLIPIDYLF